MGSAEDQLNLLLDSPAKRKHFIKSSKQKNKYLVLAQNIPSLLQLENVILVFFIKKSLWHKVGRLDSKQSRKIKLTPTGLYSGVRSAPKLFINSDFLLELLRS